MQHLVTITIDGAHPGPVVPEDFAGLSFERGPLGPGGAGVAGGLFTAGNSSLVTLWRNLGLGSLRIGGGTVDQLIPAGTGGDGFTGIDNLFAFAAVAGVKVIYSLRMLSPPASPAGDLQRSTLRLRGTSGAVTGRTWPASPSATSRTGMPTTPTRATPGIRRSTKTRRACQAVPTRPSWPGGGAWPPRSWKRRRGAAVRPGSGGLYHDDLHSPPGQRGVVDRTARP